MLTADYQMVSPGISGGNRRIVVRYTAGPFAGLRKIIGVFTAEDAEQGRIPDVLPAFPSPPAALWPDGRLGRLLRLRSTDRAVFYVEQAVDAVAAGLPAGEAS